MELQPPETAVIYGADDRCHINMFPQVRKIFLQSAAQPISPLVNIIYGADFHYIIQNRINALTLCPARNQPLFSYASKYFPGLFS